MTSLPVNKLKDQETTMIKSMQNHEYMGVSKTASESLILENLNEIEKNNKLNESVDMDQDANHKCGKWSYEEDLRLTELVNKFGSKNWRGISEGMTNRSAVQCLHRWTKILMPGLIKGPWTVDEDRKLMNWVKSNGCSKWSACADTIKGRSGKQCRERWFNTLNPSVMKGNWAAKEDFKIFKLYKVFGSKWSKIASHFKGRTENSIKNRFYSTLRRHQANDKRNSLETVSNENVINNDDSNGYNYNSKIQDLLKYLASAYEDKRQKFLESGEKDDIISHNEEEMSEKDSETTLLGKKHFMEKTSAQTEVKKEIFTTERINEIPKINFNNSKINNISKINKIPKININNSSNSNNSNNSNNVIYPSIVTKFDNSALNFSNTNDSSDFDLCNSYQYTNINNFLNSIKNLENLVKVSQGNVFNPLYFPQQQNTNMYNHYIPAQTQANNSQFTNPFTQFNQILQMNNQFLNTLPSNIYPTQLIHPIQQHINSLLSHNNGLK